MSSLSQNPPEFTDKSRKYDRQIRLWGEHGQAKLEAARVCLINATALGTEILKGIVLPGIGGYTIVDDKLVCEDDLNANFFLDETCIGQNRAKCAAKMLQELNPDVSGDYLDGEGIEQILRSNPEFFRNFTLVVATQLNDRTVIALSNLLWSMNIPFVVCRSVGFFGTIRIQVKEHCVIETHPDNKQSDLRLENPFQTLSEHFQATELTSKVPYLIVLYKFLQQYVAQTGMPPTTYKEKSKLREMIQEAMKNNEENYEEAIKAVNSSFGGGQISGNIKKILNDEACTNLNKSSTPFWILASALKDFVETEGKGMLPLAGVIPDMTADTASYINLQNIYRAQAVHDAEIVYRRAQQLLKELNMPSETITEQDARLFCREAAYLAVIRGTKISDEYSKSYHASNVSTALERPGSLMMHYVMMRAAQRFEADYGGVPRDGLEVDAVRLRSTACKLFLEWSITAEVNQDLATEICRTGGAEIHSVSAYLGGCAAHEVIKIITKQYKPINNTLIYNGITSETETFLL